MSGLDRTSWKNYLQGIVPTFNFLYQGESDPSMRTEAEMSPPINVPVKLPKHNRPIHGGRSSTRKQRQKKQQKHKQKKHTRK